MRNRGLRFAVIFLLSVCGSILWSGCKHSSQKSEAPALTLFYNSEEQGTEKNVIAQILQAQLQQHGISARLDPVSNTIFNDRLGKQDYKATLSLWYLDYNDPEGFLTDFYSKAGFRMAKSNGFIFPLTRKAKTRVRRN